MVAPKLLSSVEVASRWSRTGPPRSPQRPDPILRDLRGLVDPDCHLLIRRFLDHRSEQHLAAQTNIEVLRISTARRGGSMRDNRGCPLPNMGKKSGRCHEHIAAHRTNGAGSTTSAEYFKTARRIPEVRRIGSPDLRGSRPESPINASWIRVATQDLIAVLPSAAVRVARSGGPPRLVRLRESPESHNGTLTQSGASSIGRPFLTNQRAVCLTDLVACGGQWHSLIAYDAGLDKGCRRCTLPLITPVATGAVYFHTRGARRCAALG